MVNIQTLQKFDLFSKLKPETVKALANRVFQMNIDTGSILVIESLPTESCYFILSGQLRISRMSREGRTQVLARLGPGMPVNIISLLTGKRVNRATIETLNPASLLVLKANDLDYLLANYPDFSLKLLTLLAERLERMTDLAADLSLYSVKARLAQFLIKLADQPQSAGGWTQDEIAAEIGTVRDVVGRLLREFEAQGLITRNRHQIYLRNCQELINEAQKDK